jgi:hypothetical protein
MSNVKIPAYRQAGKFQINDKAQISRETNPIQSFKLGIRLSALPQAGF